MRALLMSALLFLAACASTPPMATNADGLDAIARDYVALILELGEREPGYVDAYYGPPEWLAAAKANPRTTPQLIQGAAALTTRLNAVPDRGLAAMSQQRKKYLLAHVSAAAARLRMLSGETLSFADEAEALFGIRPETPPLTAYDATLAELDRLVPGEGPLGDRVAAFRARYVIPKDRLDAVFRAAIAECRARTARHIALPAHERFTMSFVNNKPWSGYNYYQGDANSLIEINTDLPIYIDRAVDLGCHEGYPGHHVYNALLEQTFVKQRGWVEMSVYPLYSPMSLIAEGSANYGIDLAFPGHERTAFETRVLYPLAGLDPAMAEDGAHLLALTDRLKRAEYTIASDFLAGRIDRETALDQLQKYGLSDRARARQRLSFIETYRSYIINYGLGRDMVRAWVVRQGPDPWVGMETLLASQTLPTDLLH
ncbi:MAG: hypothetical protein J0M36_06960 [Caulobacterales bacterium]|nr:hypothetical protein [Caulobacterales bacterium]